MADLETPVNAALVMDRGEPLGNSPGDDTRRRLHVKIANTAGEPIPVSSSLPAGGATAANQELEITQLEAINANTDAIEPKLDSVISAIDAVEGDTSSIDTKLTTTNGSLASIDSKLTGVATAAHQITGNTSLASLDTKFGTLGQKPMAGSAPVVIASDQSAVPISGTVTATPNTPTALFTEKVLVAAAGTRVQLSTSSMPIQSISVKALFNNNGTIYVGDSTVAAATGVGTTAGHQLRRGESVSIPISNIDKVWVDASNNGDGVTYSAS